VATDPVKQIERQRFQDAFANDLPAVLKRLASLPPSTDAPYLTLTLDWRPDGMRPGVRAGKKFFDDEIDNIFRGTGYKAHTPPYQSFADDITRIHDKLDNGEVDAAVQGIVFVTCSNKGVFEYIPLGMPLTNRAELGPTPDLRALAKLAEDEPPYGLLVADQKHATFMVIDQTARQRSVDVNATGYPRHQQQGGWSQKRYQDRAEERVDAFVRVVADQTEQTVKQTGVDQIVLAGDEQITTMLRNALTESVRDRVVGEIRVDPHKPEEDVIVDSLPLVEHAERAREAEAVGRIENGAGPGGGSVIGPEETLTALQAGQVMELVMNDDFAIAGWADFTMPLYGVGEPPKQHPAGGDPANIVSVALEDELIRLAILEDAEIEIVRTTPPVGPDEMPDDVDSGRPRTEAAQRLDKLQGVAGILRFALSDDQSTADW